MIKQTIKKILPPSWYEQLQNLWFRGAFVTYSTPSYSQEGEDMILNSLFPESKIDGFYVDIGAYHPKRFSNTYLFYKKGWRGINIDALPGSMKIFDETRKGDVNLEIPISDREENLIFHVFLEHTVNTFSEEKAKINIAHKNKLIEKKMLKTQPLCDVLDAYLPTGQHIDFMTIDVEESDIKVLRSNDWGRYRPEIILAEDTKFDLEHIRDSEIYEFLSHQGYTLIAKTPRTLFFKRT